MRLEAGAGREVLMSVQRAVNKHPPSFCHVRNRNLLYIVGLRDSVGAYTRHDQEQFGMLAAGLV